MIFFIQIERNMNQTLTDIMKDHYKDAFLQMPNVETRKFYKTVMLLSAGKDALQMIAGQFPYGIHAEFELTSQYILMLRDPLERVISFYLHIQSDQAHPLHELAIKYPLENFIYQNYIADFNNGQTRYLSEHADFGLFPSHSHLDRGDLRLAKHNLSRCAFGLFEFPGNSVQLIAQSLGMGRIMFTIKAQKVRRTQYSPQVLQELEDVNWLDVELYEHARTLFFQRLAKVQ